MFALLHTVRSGLADITRGLEPDELTASEAAAVIDELAAVERLAAGARLRLARHIDDSVAGAEGENGPQRWLAKHTGQSLHAAGCDLAASETLDSLEATDAALREGELTAGQAHEVTSAAVLDPSAEADLLGTARNGSVAELKRHAKRVRAAATDDEQKAKAAHENRDLASSSDEETGEGKVAAKGPASSVAVMLALLEPWVRAQFDQARRDGRRERRGALAFDALLDALRFADAHRRGGASQDDDVVPTGPPVDILLRADLSAVRRGHTIAGELCEVDGFGPMSVQDLCALLPQAAIDLVCTNGIDVFNVTHFGRRTTARQDVVLDLLGGECSRLGCVATRNLQIDHRIDWAKTHVTELRALDKLCPACHRRKTHDGWALVPGRGKRRMVPPDDPAHPQNAPPASGDPPKRHATAA